MGKNNQSLSDMEDKEKAEFETLYAKYLIWKMSQENQTDGYEYERSFVEFCKEFNKGLFELSVQDASSEKKK